MPEWKYLETKPFQSRYAIAAWLLKDCKQILEIGGYRTPVTDFLYGDHEQITVADPKMEEYHATEHRGKPCKVDHYSSRYPVDIELRPGEYGLLVLGLELHLSDREWADFYYLVQRSQLAVFGVVPDHIHSVNQFDGILRNSGKSIDTTIRLDLSDNNFEALTDSAPPKCKRFIYLLR